MKERIKIGRNEIIFAIIELIILLSLSINIEFFKGDMYAGIVSIISILIGLFLTIENKKHIWMPYALIINNTFIIVVLSVGFATSDFNTLIMKFRLFGFFVSFVIFVMNIKVYEKIYIG